MAGEKLDYASGKTPRRRRSKCLILALILVALGVVPLVLLCCHTIYLPFLPEEDQEYFPVILLFGFPLLAISGIVAGWIEWRRNPPMRTAEMVGIMICVVGLVIWAPIGALAIAWAIGMGSWKD
jgi:hypothetical protein